MPIMACELLYERVFPFYETLGVGIGAGPTDNGRKSSGKPDSHPYELLLALEAIEHGTTRSRRTRRSQSPKPPDRVTVDLNGFSIIGPFDCSSGPPGAPGSGDGIVTTSGHVHVRNGMVRGIGRDGLSLGDDARVDGVTIACSGRDGISAGARARVTDNDITHTGGNGMTLGSGSTYGGNTLSAVDDRSSPVLAGYSGGGRNL
jgi:hypothetical protein